jgi:hypothetical protein
MYFCFEEPPRASFCGWISILVEILAREEGDLNEEKSAGSSLPLDYCDEKCC